MKEGGWDSPNSAITVADASQRKAHNKMTPPGESLGYFDELTQNCLKIGSMLPNEILTFI